MQHAAPSVAITTTAITAGTNEPSDSWAMHIRREGSERQAIGQMEFRGWRHPPLFAAGKHDRLAKLNINEEANAVSSIDRFGAALRAAETLMTGDGSQERSRADSNTRGHDKDGRSRTAFVL